MRLGRASVGKTPQVKNPFYQEKEYLLHRNLLHRNPFLMPNASFSKEMKPGILTFPKKNEHGAGDGQQWIQISGGSSGGST